MHYLLSKVLPLVVLPLGLAMVLLVAALLLSRRRRWLVSRALAVLSVFSTGLVEQLL